MQNVFAAFDDAQGAQRAADRLVANGFAAESVHLHGRGVPPRNAAGLTLDEYASGGFFGNIGELLDELFESPQAPQEAETYDDVVRQEAVGLSVCTGDEADARRAETLLAASGAMSVKRIGPGAAA